MLLKNCKTINDIKIIYLNHNLNTIKDKILFLKKEMGICASRHDTETEIKELYGLEELALTHIWEGLK